MTWWRRVWRGKEMEQQLEQELRFHLDQHAADLIARGRSPQQAIREARLALGGAEQVKEGCRDARGTRWLDDFRQDVRHAVRALRQRPGFAAVTLATLALGIGATTVMFTVINGVLLKQLSYPEPDRLVAVHGHTETFGDQWMSYPNFLDCQRESRSYASIAAWAYSAGTVSEPGDAEYVSARQISASLFTAYGVAPSPGRAFLPEDDRLGAAPVAIISDRLWQRRFHGSRAIVGSALVFDGKSYAVVGVAPAGFQLDGDADVYTPLGQYSDTRLRNREASFLHVVARLGPGLSMADAQSELTLVGRRLAEQFPKENGGRSFTVRPLRQDVVGNVQASLWLLLGAVSVVLLIACVNIASLLLARAVSRERELAMRMALGAGRSRLVRQCLTESGVLGIVGGALGVGLAAIGVRPFVAIWPGNLPRAEEIQFDWRLLLFALATSLACSVLFGLAPTWWASGRELDQRLRAGSRTLTGRSGRMHGRFVMSEIALAVVLLVTAGILGRAVLRLSSLDPGLDVHNVLVARVSISPTVLDNPERIRASWSDVLDRARRLPGVESAALSDIIPMRVGDNGLGYWTTAEQPPQNRMPIALASGVTPDYLDVMRVPLRRGRFFTDHDRMGAEPVVVIDEVLAQHAFGGGDPVGQRLSLQAIGPSRVVGVVGHVRHWGLASDDQARMRDQIYYPFAQVPDRLMRLFSTFMSMAVRTRVEPLSVVEALRRELRGATGDQTLYQVRTMEQLASASFASQRFLMTLFGVFASLAVLLACVGIYGVMSYVTSQRVPEIGLRMALGASARDVMRQVFGESLGMILVGVGAGAAAAVAAARLLERFVDGVRFMEPLTFGVTVAIFVAAASVAGFLPARRASRVDPMCALRQD